MATFKDRFTLENVKVIAQTLWPDGSVKAIRIESDDWLSDEPLWIPQSQIDDDSEVWKMGQEGDLIISEWIAKQKKIA